MAGWWDGRPVASGTTLSKPSALRSSASTKASMTRTGLSSPIQSSRLSGNRVVWLRSTPSTKRLIGSPKQNRQSYHRPRFDTPRVIQGNVLQVSSVRCSPPELTFGVLPPRVDKGSSGSSISQVLVFELLSSKYAG